MYQEVAPRNWASQFIETYWIEKNDTELTKEVLVYPDGCSDIIVSYTDNSYESFVIGCMTKPLKASIKPGEVMCGIRFYPGCSSAFLKISMKEVTNKKYPLKDIINKDLNLILLNRTEDHAKMIPQLFESHLKNMFSENHYERIGFTGASLIKQQYGTSSIENIADQLNISRRSFERKFIHSVGITPKQYSRIVRFLHVKHLLRKHQDIPIIDLALDAGYYDQAHFCREFKEFTGMTPLMKRSMTHFYNTLSLK